MAESGKKVATIERHCAAINKAHALRGVVSPMNDAAFKILLSGIRRVKGVRQKQTPAFALELLKSAVKEIDATTLSGARDKVILLLGFAGGFRRSELTALNIEDLHFTASELIVNLRRSKTNQYGNDEEKAIFPSSDVEVCPIAAVQAWVKMLRRKTGPLLVSLRTNDALTERRITDKYLNLFVKNRLGSRYSALSLRASFVTVAKLEALKTVR